MNNRLEDEFNRNQKEDPIFKESISLLINDIKNEQIKTWEELRIRAALHGLLDERMMLYSLIRYISIFEVFEFFSGLVHTKDNIDSFFEDGEMIEAVLFMNGHVIRQSGSNNFFNTYTMYFSSNSFFDMLERRHPVYFLKYFLKQDPTDSFDDKMVKSYLELLKMVINRSSERIKFIKNPKYADYLDRLTNKKLGLMKNRCVYC